MVGTTDLDFHTVVGATFYTGLLIICFGTATILTIWIKVTNVRCQLPNPHDIGNIRTTRNLDSILLNIFLVSLIILNAILFNIYYKGYFFRLIFNFLLNPTNFDSDFHHYSILFFRVSMEKLGEYPVWCALYFGQILQPMLALVAIATKILVKYGRDMRKVGILW